MDFSRAAALLMASSGNATSISLLPMALPRRAQDSLIRAAAKSPSVRTRIRLPAVMRWSLVRNVSQACSNAVAT